MCRDVGGDDHKKHRGHSRHYDVVLFAAIALHEAPVEIRDQIGCAPIQLRGHRGHERRKEPRKHQTAQRVRNVFHHNAHIRRLGLREAWIKNDHRQRCQYPRPGAQGVMRHVVPQYGKQAVAFVARAENPLRNVPAAARLGSGIPKRPPLHAKEHRESDHRKRPHRLICERTRKIGKERRRVAGCRSRRDGHRMEFRKQRVHPSNGVNRVPSNADDNGHFQYKLKKIRPQDAPQSAKRHVQARERNQNQNADQLRGGFAQSQADGHDSGHRFGDPPENQAVH